MRDWQLVLPVKGGPGAKSRLVGTGVERGRLAAAIALDCVATAVRCPVVGQVVVVTADGALADAARALGARWTAEASPGAGLLAAVADGLAALDPDAPAAVLLADVPAAGPDDLAAALGAAARATSGGAQAYLPDAEGTGTVLLAARSRDRLRPRFGPASAAAHRADGAVRLDVELPRLRRDVDSLDALRQAAAMGLGPRTAALVAGAA